MLKQGNKDHLFFHDLINHIHGMLLFVNCRMENNKGLVFSDCEKLIKELEMSESLIQNHFNHKKPPIHADISLIKKKLKSVITSFLPEKSCKINFKEDAHGVIHYITFYRIISNIVKNMAESQAENFEFDFITRQDGLHFITKNKINLKKNKDNKESLGLVSIKSLCREEGGEFKFFTKKDMWINEVFLPWYNTNRSS